MKRPNAIPSCPGPAGEILVEAGLLKLPGASGLEMPSTRRTRITSSVEHIPRIEVYESRARGQKTEGMRLCAEKLEGEEEEDIR